MLRTYSARARGTRGRHDGEGDRVWATERFAIDLIGVFQGRAGLAWQRSEAFEDVLETWHHHYAIPTLRGVIEIGCDEEQVLGASAPDNPEPRRWVELVTPQLQASQRPVAHDPKVVANINPVPRICSPAAHSARKFQEVRLELRSSTLVAAEGNTIVRGVRGQPTIATTDTELNHLIAVETRHVIVDEFIGWCAQPTSAGDVAMLIGSQGDIH